MSLPERELVPSRQIVLLAEHDGEPAPRRVAGDARAVDAAADDGEVDYAGSGHWRSRQSCRAFPTSSPSRERVTLR